MNLVTDARLVLSYTVDQIFVIENLQQTALSISMFKSHKKLCLHGSCVIKMYSILTVKWWAGMANIEKYTTQLLRNSRNSKLFPLSTVLILCCFLMQEYWLMYWCTVEIELSSNVILYLTWPLSMSLHFVVTRHILTKQGVSCMHCVSLSTRVIL